MKKFGSWLFACATLGALWLEFRTKPALFWSRFPSLYYEMAIPTVFCGVSGVAMMQLLGNKIDALTKRNEKRVGALLDKLGQGLMAIGFGGIGIMFFYLQVVGISQNVLNLFNGRYHIELLIAMVQLKPFWILAAVVVLGGISASLAASVDTNTALVQREPD